MVYTLDSEDLRPGGLNPGRLEKLGLPSFDLGSKILGLYRLGAYRLRGLKAQALEFEAGDTLSGLEHTICPAGSGARFGELKMYSLALGPTVPGPTGLGAYVLERPTWELEEPGGLQA